MAFNGLRLEYSLGGSSNYIEGKDHMEALLEDNGIKDFIDQEVPKPNDATQPMEWKMCMARARRMIPEEVRDHIVSSLHGKEAPFSMWKTLKDLYQNSSDQRKLSPKVDDDMEEIRWSTRDGSSSKHDDEENLFLATKGMKGKGKTSQSKSYQGGKKFDKSKVRCFHCHEVGHYATNCLRKKSKKDSSKQSDGELNSRASFHISCVKNLFSTLEEKDLQIWIEMDDDGKYHVSAEGTILFQREHGSPLTLSNFMYVPGLKRNLVSIARLENKGYDVVFSLGNVLLRHIDTRQTKKIGIRIKNLYKLKVNGCVAPSSKVDMVHDIGELWHRKMG
eukprot:PITA_28635